MTIYVFNSGPFIDLFHHYYPSRFPTLWRYFDERIQIGRFTSTREVLNELQDYEDNLAGWCNLHRTLFKTPTAMELEIVRKIFEVPHFQTLIKKKTLMQAKPFADPFVIAMTKCLNGGCVVANEKNKPNAVNIPNVCKYFLVDCTD